MSNRRLPPDQPQRHLHVTRVDGEITEINVERPFLTGPCLLHVGDGKGGWTFLGVVDGLNTIMPVYRKDSHDT